MTPDFAISASGDITSAIAKTFISLNITDSKGLESDRLIITIGDPYNNIALPTRDTVLSVSVGYKETGLVFKGAFAVDDTEHFGSGHLDKIIIRAKAAGMISSLTGKNHKTISWHYPDTHTSLGDIITKIAGGLGLKASVSPRYFNIKILHIDQHTESDINFVHYLARRHDAICKISNVTLIFNERDKLHISDGLQRSAISIKRDKELMTHRLINKGRTEYTKVKAKYYDYDKAKRESVSAGSSGQGKTKTLKQIYRDEEQAKEAANSEAQRLRRDVQQLELSLARGEGYYFAEQDYQVSKFPVDIDGQWVSTQVITNLDINTGLTNRIQLEKP